MDTAHNPKRSRRDAYLRALDNPGGPASLEEVLASHSPPSATQIRPKRLTAALAKRLKDRWWFIHRTKDFDTFKGSPVCQHYEIVIRHPGFASWASCHLSSGWCCLNCGAVTFSKHRPIHCSNPECLMLEADFEAWDPTSGSGQMKPVCKAFAPEFRRCFPGAGASKVLLKGGALDGWRSPRLVLNVSVAHDEKLFRQIGTLLESLVEARIVAGETERPPGDQAWAPSDLIRGIYPFEWSSRTRAWLAAGVEIINPDVAILDLSELIADLASRSKGYRRHVEAAIRTFLTKNRDYQRFRRWRLQQNDFRRSRPKRAHRSSAARVRPPAPETLACALVACDWRSAGQRLSELSPWLKRNGLTLEAVGRNVDSTLTAYWQNCLTALEKCFRRVALRSDTTLRQ